MKNANSPLNVVIVYARVDEPLLKELKMQLAPLKRSRIIDIWDDCEIVPGTYWAEEIKRRLFTAHIILFLISPAFIASDYCFLTEMSYAIKRHRLGKVRIIPVILRHVDWKPLLGDIQALPKDAKPVVGSSWHSREEAFLDVVQGIRIVATELNGGQQPSFSIHSPSPRPSLHKSFFVILFVLSLFIASLGMFTFLHFNVISTTDGAQTQDMENSQRSFDGGSVVTTTTNVPSSPVTMTPIVSPTTTMTPTDKTLSENILLQCASALSDACNEVPLNLILDTVVEDTSNNDLLLNFTVTNKISTPITLTSIDPDNNQMSDIILQDPEGTSTSADGGTLFSYLNLSSHASLPATATVPLNPIPGVSYTLQVTLTILEGENGIFPSYGNVAFSF
jgi:hypothetical protein